MIDPGKQWQIRQGDVREVLAGMDDQSASILIPLVQQALGR